MSARPPLLARWLVTLGLRGEMREVVRGDLDEEFHEAIASGTPARAARTRYWRQAAASIAARRANAASPDSFSGAPMPRFQFASLTSGLVADLKHVVRRLRASPGFALVAILSLAIGIGANTAIASVARAVLIDRMPVERAEQLAVLYWSRSLSVSNMGSASYTDPASGQAYESNFSYPLYQQLRDTAPTGTSVAAFSFVPQAFVSVSGRPTVAVGGLLVSGNYFSTMRPQIILGRPLTDDDDRQGAEPVAVLGYTFWQEIFNRSTSVLNSTVNVNGVAARVVGVSGPGFRGPSPGGFFPKTDVSMALAMQPLVVPKWNREGVSFFTSDRHYWLRTLMRLPATSARPSLTPFLEATLRGYVQGARLTDDAGIAKIHPLLVDGSRGLDDQGSGGNPMRQSFLIIGVVSGIVLLIACINLASLMLARGIATQRDAAIRRSLGASRWRLVRLTLLESFVLAFLGAAVGVAVAAAGRAALATMMISLVGPWASDLPLDRGLLLTTVGLASMAALIAGLLPSMRLSSRAAAGAINERPGGTTAPRLLIGRVLLAIQIGVSLPLLAGAGLLLRTVHNLASVDLGFRPESLALFNVDASAISGATPNPAATYDAILARLRTLPGVEAASMSENPLLNNISSNNTIQFEGAPDKGVRMMMNAVGPDYFETMGIPILQGRALDARDGAGVNSVVVNETAARTVFQGGALGRHFWVGSGRGRLDYEVVGVAADSKYTTVRTDIKPGFFDYHSRRAPYGGMNFVIRTSRPPAEYERAFRDVVNDVNPVLAVTKFRTQAEQINQSIGRERAFAFLLTLFGGFALVLASVGLHGVTAYSVARRTNEIGIRLALGAQRIEVLWLIMRQVLILGVAGLALGVPIALAAGPAIRALLFGLTSTDVVTLAISGITMLAVTVLAGFLPARRAAALDPLAAIRRE